MRPSKTELVVPVRDRRQRRRILTLKNFRNAAIVVVALTVAVVVEEQFRGNKPAEGFGRLTEKQVETTSQVPRQPAPPAATSIDDRDGADASLVAAAARSQILRAEGENTATAPPVSNTNTEASIISAPRQSTESHVAIVDGPGGVTIVKKPGERPVLGGGFGRQP